MQYAQVTDDFQQVILDNPLIFIYFFADWCAPCKEFSPVYERVAQQFSKIQFLKVNIEKQQSLVDSLGVHSVPYLMAVKEGIVVYVEAGIVPEEILVALANQLVA